MSTLDDAIEAIKSGNKETGRQILEQVLEEEENNEEIWLWLSTVVESDDDREICLENVLALNPDHAVAQKALNAVRDGHFDPRDIIGEVSEEAPPPDITFHDEFFGENEAASTDLEMPSVMGGSPEPRIKQKREAAKKSKGLNVRLIALIGVGLLVCLVLAGIAAFMLLSGSDDSSIPVEVQPGQATPAGPESDGSVATSVPEVTLTPTNTPLLLPTSKPTGEPTPTATQVVSPTPPRAPEEEPAEDSGG
jgi:hypothetical protein